MMEKRIIAAVLITAVFSFLPAGAQTVKKDSTKLAAALKIRRDTGQQNDTTRSDTAGVDTMAGEIILDEIYIEGQIDKPGVIIIPKRLAPKLEEKGLKRSFKEELTNGSGEIIKPQKELQKVERVESIKKALEKKRKKKK